MTTAAPTHETLLAHLRSAATALVPAERRVAEVLIRQLHRLEEYSAVALAAEARCSAATVVRACQRMGFSGFQQLRLQSIRVAASQRDRDATGLPSHHGGSVHDALLKQVFTAAITDVRASQAMLDRQVFDRAVARLAAAGTILLAGTGGSSIPAQDAALRLTMSGRTAVAPHDVLGQQFAARLLKPSDACIAVSYSGANRHTLQTVQAAGHAGATVIAVTSSGISDLAKVADLVLVTGSEERDSEILVSRISHTLVLNALNLAVQRMSGQPAFGPAGELADLLSDTLDSGPAQW